jgi:prepilin-type N-terminal cleavage/methylation domain-containing protein
MRGFTLIEIVVAIVLLEIGVLGVIGTLTIASRTMTRAETLEAATITAGRIVDSLAIYGMVEEGGVGFAGGRVSWRADGLTPWVFGLDESGDTLLRVLVPGRR